MLAESRNGWIEPTKHRIVGVIYILGHTSLSLLQYIRVTKEIMIKEEKRREKKSSILRRMRGPRGPGRRPPWRGRGESAGRGGTGPTGEWRTVRCGLAGRSPHCTSRLSIWS